MAGKPRKKPTDHPPAQEFPAQEQIPFADLFHPDVALVGTGASMMEATNLRVTLDGDVVEFDDFSNITGGMLALLQDVEKEITENKRAKAEWAVTSPPELQLTVSPNGVSAEQLTRIADTTHQTLSRVQARLAAGEDIGGLGLTSKRRNALERLIKPLRDEISKIIFDFYGRDLIEIEYQGASDRTEREYVDEIRTLDGIVDLISVRPPKPFFSLRENNSQRIVRIFYRDDQFEDVRNALGKTAEVAGMTRARPDGTLLWMRDIELFVYPDDVPDPRLLGGSLPDLIGDQSIDDYMDVLRGRNAESF